MYPVRYCTSNEEKKHTYTRNQKYIPGISLQWISFLVISWIEAKPFKQNRYIVDTLQRLLVKDDAKFSETCESTLRIFSGISLFQLLCISNFSFFSSDYFPIFISNFFISNVSQYTASPYINQMQTSLRPPVFKRKSIFVILMAFFLKKIRFSV